MRQGQQNRRGRGRNNNRKGGHHNPLSRSFESNGPDVKIRGTPAHIAEKYLALARDAQSSGDPVLAENYLQHAEHYSRIIMAYREQLNPPGDGMNSNGQRMRGDGEGSGGEEFGEDDGEDGGIDEGFPQPIVPQQTHQHQPRQHEGGQHRHDRNFRRDQGGRHRDRFNDRGDRERQYDRDRPMEGRPQPQQDRQPQDQQPAAGEGDFRRRERFPQQAHEQPEFLRRPVRRTRAENGESAPGKDDQAGD